MNDIMITLQSQWPVIDLLHERWPVTGAWTILPVLSRSVTNSTKHIWAHFNLQCVPQHIHDFNNFVSIRICLGFV